MSDDDKDPSVDDNGDEVEEEVGEEEDVDAAAVGEEALPEVVVVAVAANVDLGAVAAVVVVVIVTVSIPPFLKLVVPLSFSIILHALIPLNDGLWLLLSLSLLLLVVVVNAAARPTSSITTNLSSSSSHLLPPPGTVIIPESLDIGCPVVEASAAAAAGVAAVELESSREG